MSNPVCIICDREFTDEEMRGRCPIHGMTLFKKENGKFASCFSCDSEEYNRRNLI